MLTSDKVGNYLPSRVCFLYERYVAAYLDSIGKQADLPAKKAQFATDFVVPLYVAEAYWNVVRNGFLHQGMGLQKGRGVALPKWRIESRTRASS